LDELDALRIELH
jgi:hypothetical protein